MNKKWMAIVTLLVLILSVCVFALAEEPTDPVYPVPGPLEKHEHTVSVKIVDRGYTAHRLQEWCPDCGKLLKERLEKHNFVDGVCTVCDWECPHPPEAAEKHYERDGVKPQWDGNYIICPGWEITECGVCRTELSRVETTVREFHNIHTHFTPVLECLPHDAETHELIRYCDECGTEVSEYVPHNCPPSDRPYRDDDDPDTHIRLVRCDDCGFWVPQRQAHTWVHDAYTEFDGMGDYHNEVLHCSVCGAVKQVPLKHEWKLISCNADNGGKTHTSSYECTVCGNCKEMTLPHTLVHYIYKNDGSSEGHIEVLECTECRQLIDGERLSHTPTRLYWKSISDTQDQLTVQCNLCGLTYQEAPENHKFDAKSYESDGSAAGYHTVYKICIKCGTRDLNAKTVKEKHSFSRRVCTECGQAQEHDGGHTPNRDPKGWVSINENQHAAQYLCVSMYPNLCGVIYTDYSTVNNHTFDPITMKCTGCGYLKEGCEHDFKCVLDEFRGNENEHFYMGTCTKCGKTRTYFESHDMVLKSATEYTSDANGHYRTLDYYCSVCGYENVYEEKNGHQFEYSQQYRNKSTEEHHVTTKRACAVCGYVHWITEVDERHTLVENREYYLDHGYGYHFHYFNWRCSVCGLGGYRYLPDEPHEFVNGRCQKCFVLEPKNDAYVSEESVTQGSVDQQQSSIPDPVVICVMTVNGTAVPAVEQLMSVDGEQGFDLYICPETYPAGGVIELRFDAALGFEIMRQSGVRNVYLRLSDTDFPLLSEIGQALTVLSGQERDELVITLTPGNDGVYTAQYDPAGVYITE